MNMRDYEKVADRIQPSESCREKALAAKNENNRKNIRYRPAKRRIIAISIAAAAACGCTVAAAAANRSSFDKLVGKSERTVTYENGYTGPLDKFDRNDYEQIAPHAVQFEEVKSASNQYFKVDLDSAYVDGTELIFGFTGEIADGNSQSLSMLNFSTALQINGEDIKRPDCPTYPDNYCWSGSFVIDEGTANSFTGSMTCVLPPEVRFDDKAEVTVKFTNIWANEKSHYDAALEHDVAYQVMPLKQENFLTLSTNITADTSLVKQINKTVEKDGFSLTVYSISPAMMLVRTEYPESYDIAEREELENGTADGHARTVHPMAVLFDENGKAIQPLGMNPVDMGDGKLASACVPTDSKKITVKFCDKNCSSNEKGSVEWDDKMYGHYSFGYITELTLDLG